MNLGEMILQYRRAAQDHEQPGLVDTPELVSLFNEAEREAVIRGRLLLEIADPAICEIVVSPGQSAYRLHPTIYELTHLGFKREGGFRRTPVYLTSIEELDHSCRDWRDTEGEPTSAIQTDRSLHLVPTPVASGVLHVEGYRLPRKPMKDESDTPEIHHIHHGYLHLWVLHRVFSIPDAELFDPARAAAAEEEFTRYFGLRPDSDLRRSTRHDAPHTNKPFFV